MQHSSFDLRDFISGALSRTKTNGAESRKVEMLCEGCCTKFPFYKRKKQCGECHLVYCSNCLTSPNSVHPSTATSVLSRIIDKNQQFCRNCRVLLTRPLCRADLRKLRVKDLQHYLTAHHVSVKGCVEKEDLVNLLIRYVGSAGSYNDVRQTGSGAAAFNTQSSPDAEQPQAFYSNPARRSSVPNLPSPTDASPTIHSTQPNSETPINNNNSNIPSNTVPLISSPSLGSAIASTSHPQPNSAVMDVEELTDWDDLGEEAMELGPEPVVLELDDETNNLPLPTGEQNNVLIHEVVDEHSTSPVAETSSEPSSAQDSPAQTSRFLVLSSIKSLDDLEQLSIKQLKELLVRNRVDFRGCVERTELVERVTRLWMESVQTRKELDNLTMDELCKICMDAPVECVMLECGHMATCTACGKQLNECPICRQYVVRVVRIFKA